jgi:hypothetical protein
MSILGPDGKPRAVDPSEARCVLCLAELGRPLIGDRENSPDGHGDRMAGFQTGLAFGYFVGIQLMASVLVGSGLEPEKAAHVQDAASSLCENHTSVVKDTGEAYRAPVEQAVKNLQAKATFLVGRSAGGKVRVTP